MRNKSKITTLESKFPLLSIEQGCMVSKDADITVAFRVELPELFTVTSTEYEAMHSAWHKAIKVLPNYSIVHKQDWFIKEDYQGKLSDGGLSFLARSSERHFNERPYLHHSVYLFLFAGGLLAVFILVVILYLCGVSQVTCLIIGVVGASLVVWQTFAMNRKYGQYGLMKKGAVRMHPRYLVNRRTVCHLIRNLQPKKAKK